jgi:predicted TIM-barrel fold metal-dependent hydrolase
MAHNGFKVIDCDMHVVEPADLWLRYIDPAYKSIAPVGTNSRPRDIGTTMLGKLRTGYANWFEPLEKHMAPLDPDYDFAVKGGYDGASQLEAMDREGIDVAVMFPSRGLFVLGIDTKAVAGEMGYDPPQAAAIARAYNDWLYDFCAPDRRRLLGAAMVAVHDVDSAVTEARRCVEQYGFKAIFLKPGMINKRAWHDRAYDSLWAECQRLNIAVGFHGASDFLTDFGLGLHQYMSTWHTFSHPLGPMSALVAMVGGGVFERFPRLRAAFLEGNCSWAPWLLTRLDDHFEDYIGRFELPLRMKPSEYFKRNCWVSVECDEETSRLYVDWFGDDNVVFSTDYPHPDSKFPHAVARFLKLPLSAQAKRKFLWDNCVRLYDIHD